jgi:hypothetical protein
MAGKRGISVKDLFGGRFISPETVKRSMMAVEKRLTADFVERTRLRRQFNTPLKKLRAPIAGAAGKDSAGAAASREMARLHKLARGLKVRRPRAMRVSTGIFTGLTGATVAPPYDYQWTWGAVAGTANANSETADRRTGDISLDLNTNPDDSSSAAGRAAVGIYFYPPAGGILQIWSAPAFDYLWATICDLDSAHADAWIGLYVASYDLAGAFTGAVLDQRVTLWSDDSWLYGSRLNQGSNSGYGLYPPPIQVDRQHQYIIWVWCGGEVSADGWHFLYGSAAIDTLNAVVPSITWELRTVYQVEGA